MAWERDAIAGGWRVVPAHRMLGQGDDADWLVRRTCATLRVPTCQKSTSVSPLKAGLCANLIQPSFPCQRLLLPNGQSGEARKR